MCPKGLKPTETVRNLQTGFLMKGNKKQAPVSLWHLQQVFESADEKRQNSTIQTCFHVSTNAIHRQIVFGFFPSLRWHFWLLLDFWGRVWFRNNVFISKLLNLISKDKSQNRSLLLIICVFLTFTGQNCNWWFSGFRTSTRRLNLLPLDAINRLGSLGGNVWNVSFRGVAGASHG